MENILFAIGMCMVVVFAGLAIYHFCKLGRDKQIEMVMEWLLLAVIEAEKLLGDGTGQVKLRYVYNMFIDKFKYLAMIITFDQFSGLVDIALDKMREMLKNNEKVRNYVGGENNEEQ